MTKTHTTFNRNHRMHQHNLHLKLDEIKKKQIKTTNKNVAVK